MSYLYWVGGRQTVEHHFPEFSGKYIEPFCGACRLFFRHRPSMPDKQYILSDNNEPLIAAHKFVRDRLDDIVSTLYEIQLKYDLSDPFSFVDRLTDDERVVWWLWINRSWCRERGKNERRRDVEAWVESLSFFADYLQDTTLACRDFAESLDDVQGGDFIYIDPPGLLPIHRYPFTENDVERLHEYCLEIDERGAEFMIFFRDYMSDWDWPRIGTDGVRVLSNAFGSTTSLPKSRFRGLQPQFGHPPTVV